MPRTKLHLPQTTYRAAVRRLERLRARAEADGNLAVALQVSKELHRLKAITPAAAPEPGECESCDLVCRHLRPILRLLSEQGTLPGPGGAEFFDSAPSEELARIAAQELRRLLKV